MMHPVRWPLVLPAVGRPNSRPSSTDDLRQRRGSQETGNAESRFRGQRLRGRQYNDGGSCRDELAQRIRPRRFDRKVLRFECLAQHG